jgi:hypothetical protein
MNGGPFEARCVILLNSYRFLPGPVAQLIRDLAQQVDALTARVSELQKK